MENLTKEQQDQEASYVFPYHYFDLRRGFYPQLVGNIEYVAYLNIVKKLLAPYNGQNILDAGCGDGRFCYEMRDENARVVGVDFSDRAIRFAQAFNPDGEFHIGDLEKLDLPDTFDQAVMIETLEHLMPEKIPVILENVARVLKPGAILIVTVPSDNLPVSTKHYQHFNPQSLKRALEPHFTVRKVFGHTKSGPKRKVFALLKTFAFLSSKIEDKIPLLPKFYAWLRDFYTRHLAAGSPRHSQGLIAVCVKNG